MSISLDTQPDEIIVNILRFLPPKDNAKISRVCRRFQQLAEENSIWEALTRHYYPNFNFSEEAQALSWKERFREVPTIKMYKDLTHQINEDVADFMVEFMEFIGAEITSWTLNEDSSFKVTCLSTSDDLFCHCDKEKTYSSEKEICGKILNEEITKIKFLSGFTHSVDGASKTIWSRLKILPQGLAITIGKGAHVIYPILESKNSGEEVAEENS